MNFLDNKFCQHLDWFEQSQIDRLEQQIRLLKREQRDLEQRARSLVNRCKQVIIIIIIMANRHIPTSQKPTMVGF